MCRPTICQEYTRSQANVILILGEDKYNTQKRIQLNKY